MQYRPYIALLPLALSALAMSQMAFGQTASETPSVTQPLECGASDGDRASESRASPILILPDSGDSTSIKASSPLWESFEDGLSSQLGEAGITARRPSDISDLADTDAGETSQTSLKAYQESCTLLFGSECQAIVFAKLTVTAKSQPFGTIIVSQVDATVLDGRAGTTRLETASRNSPAPGNCGADCLQAVAQTSLQSLASSMAEPLASAPAHPGSTCR